MRSDIKVGKMQYEVDRSGRAAKGAGDATIAGDASTCAHPSSHSATPRPSHSPPTAYRLPPTASARRGVLLLVILSLLILFVMIAVTYVLVATRHLAASRSYAKASTNSDSPQKLLDGAMRQLLVGTPADPNTLAFRSVIGPHSLLEDFYGGPNGAPILCGKINSTQSLVSGQIIELDVTGDSSSPFALPSGTNATVSQVEGYYEGCLLTIVQSTNGANALSSRIVRHTYDANTSKTLLRILPLNGNGGSVTLSGQEKFIVNGRPFAGTGFGFNPTGTAKTVDAMSSDTLINTLSTPMKMEYALLPNPVMYKPTGDYATPSNAPFGGWGGANEDYDAPDYQNMHMAWVDGSTPPKVILPSFHRPDLINFWLKHVQTPNPAITYPGDPGFTWTSPGGKELLRSIMLRPLGPMSVDGTALSGTAQVDHLNFTGSNPSFDAVKGPWDIDNDGDGIPDSVWLDLGYPVQSTSDGRLFKPLFAILCVDLDGRLNVNAHGTTEQIDTTNTYKHDDPIPANAGALKPFAGTNGQTAVTLPRGEGFGPAEIDPVAAGLSVTEVTQMLRGSTSGTQSFQGRYAGTPGGTDQAGKLNSDDALGMVKHFQFPDRLYSTYGAFRGTPSDIWGRAAVGIDYNGQPYYWGPTLNGYTGSWMQGETRNSPYDLNLSRSAGNPGASSGTQANDNPFTVSELERLLRQSDIDSAELPQRLWHLSGAASLYSSGTATALADAARRGRLLTTDSWDTPDVNGLYPLAARRQVLIQQPQVEQFSSNSMAAWVGFKLRSPAPEAAATVRESNNDLRELLAPELISGLRMNINRPLGDGRDNNANGVIDEPIDTEIASEGQSTGANAPSWTAAYGTNIPKLNLTNGLSVSGPNPTDQKTYISVVDELNARQLLARHLYVLARLVIDDRFLVSSDNHWFDDDPDASIKNDAAPYGIKYKASVRRIAQWAVNVVDFMDADSIMTPFEYDLYPFSTTDLSNGTPKTQKDPSLKRTWCVDGIIDDPNPSLPPNSDDDKSWRGLVWGVERPELLITETFAFHDRRTTDEDNEQPDLIETGDNHKKNKTTAMMDPDASFDQKYMPRSGFFVELYNPWSDNNLYRPAEFYPPNTYSPGVNSGIVLDKQSGGTTPSPIWRLAISKSADKAPDDPNATAADRIDRSVYFRNFPQTGTPSDPNDDGARYYTDLGVSAVVKPGRYAVIGSSGDDPPVVSGTSSSYEICIGRHKPASDGSRLGLNVDSTRRIVLTPNNNPDTNQVEVLSNNNPSDPAAADLAPRVAVVINKPGSLSVSAPKATMMRPKGYPTDNVNDPLLQPQGISWGTPAPTPYNEGQYRPPIDIPLDQQPLVQTDAELLAAVKENGFRDDFRRVHLQRLANPLKPWHVTQNPYLTIDSMAVPLTKFNGIDDSKDDGSGYEPIPGATTLDAGRNPDKLITYERGDEVGAVNRNLWRHDFTKPHATTTTTTQDSSHAMGRILQHSLGYLNNPYAPRFNSGNTPASPNDVGGQKFYLGAPDSTGGAQTFPWLVWNNRPFTSVSELMLVPASSSSRLAREVTTRTGGGNPYKDDFSGTNRVGFGHLLNYFNSDASSNKAPNMANILEYLCVPSPFTGTETVLNPKKFEWDWNQANQYAGESTSTTPNSAGVGTEPAGTAGLHPPFNTVSNHRDPGRVNINTVAFPQVWNAILGGTGEAGPGPTFNNVRDSRQGYTGGAYAFDNSYPSIFSNPFRSAAGADMVPIPSLALTRPVNATLWRAGGVRPAINTNAQPLLAQNTNPQQAYNSNQRNSYFYFQPLDRLTSKLTTHSNVYAVWVTVGYFEVSAAPAAPAAPAIDPWPDRYQLGQELGSDTGEIERHRSFYIIDRSIPVGFERGQDLNSNDTVLLKRFIE
jgi:hypothetical protein